MTRLSPPGTVSEQDYADTVERNLSGQRSLSPSLDTCVEVVRSSRQYLIISEDVFNSSITTMYHNAARHRKSEFPLYALYNAISFCSTVAVQSALGTKNSVVTYPQALFDFPAKLPSDPIQDRRRPSPVRDESASNPTTPSSTSVELPSSPSSSSFEAPATTSSMSSTPGPTTPTSQSPTMPHISARPQSQSTASPTLLFGAPNSTPLRLPTGAFDFTFPFAASNLPQTSTGAHGDGDDVMADAVPAGPGEPVHDEYRERPDASDEEFDKDVSKGEEGEEGEDAPTVMERMLSPGIKLTIKSGHRLPDFARVIICNPYPNSDGQGTSSSTQDHSTLVDSWEVKRLYTSYDWLSPSAAAAALRLIRSHMPQVYDMVQAAFQSNPEWDTVAVLLLIGPYFSQFIWSRSQLPEDFPASKPEVMARQSTPPTPAPHEDPVTPPTRQERLRTYANAISWLEEALQEIRNRAHPIVPYLNQPVFVRCGENGAVALSDSFHNALAHAWATFDGHQLEHQASWFKTEAEQISQDQLDDNSHNVNAWLRVDEDAINEVLVALDPSRKAEFATAADGERTPTSGGTATTTSSDSNSSGSSYIPSSDASTGRARVPQFCYPKGGSPSDRESRQAQGGRRPTRDFVFPVQPRAAPLPTLTSQLARRRRQREHYAISYKYAIEVLPDVV